MASRLVLLVTLAVSLAITGGSAACTNGAVRGTRCTVQCGIDYPGGDYKQIRVSSFSDCVTACNGDSVCTDAQYHTDNGYCYLKNKLTSSRSASNVDSVICPPPKPSTTTTTTTKKTTTTTTTTSTSPAPSCTPNGSGVKAAGSTCTYTVRCGIIIDSADPGQSDFQVKNLQACVDLAAANKAPSFYFVEDGSYCYILPKPAAASQIAIADGYDSGFLENSGCGPT